jgi:hypothetical protein
MSNPQRARPLIIILLVLATSAQAWNFPGHRMITLLALERLMTTAPASAPADSAASQPEPLPAFLSDPAVRRRIAEQSGEPDRWRGTRVVYLSHENAPDHFIDVEDLEQFGLTLRTIPRERMEFIAAMAIAGERNPEKLAPYDAAKDWDKTKRWPGFVQHAILEHYSKLQSSFNTYRLLQALVSEGRANADWLEQPRENIIYHMGILSHFVGDTAQPLHTTRHFNGWVGENPDGFTTAKTFHGYIDGGVVDLHKFSEASLAVPLAQAPAIVINAKDPWNDVLTYIERSHSRMRPLYEMQKSGELQREPGRVFIEERLVDASAMLASMYQAAWEASTPTDDQMANFIRNTPFLTTPMTISAPKKP